MMLATQLKDMNAEELLGVIGPIFYLLPLVLVLVLWTPVFAWIKTLAPKFMLSYMDAEGMAEGQKREYLTKYLDRQSMRDCRKGRKNCPVCGKNYAVKTMVTNARGDVVEEWLDAGCPSCGTRVCKTTEEDNRRYYYIERRKTTSPKEERYQRVFDKLNSYIEFYKPFVDTSSSSDDGDGNIRVDVYIH